MRSHTKRHTSHKNPQGGDLPRPTSPHTPTNDLVTQPLSISRSPYRNKGFHPKTHIRNPQPNPIHLRFTGLLPNPNPTRGQPMGAAGDKETTTRMSAMGLRRRRQCSSLRSNEDNEAPPTPRVFTPTPCVFLNVYVLAILPTISKY